ncbi:hypothetical protein C0993_009337, partial [Termitomyces sp. T159_Od127]
MSSDSWSPPTPTTRTSTAAPSACPSDLASGTPPVPGTRPSMTPHWTADWFSLMQQMQLTLATLERRLAALESEHVIAATQTAAKRSNAPVAHCSAPPGRPKPSKSSQTPTGRGLKQAHDLSGSWLAAFTVGPASSKGRRFVTIWGTDQQIGEALVVFGKRIAKKHVHALRKQQSGNAVPAVAAPAPSRANASSTPKPPTLSTPPPPPMACVPDSTLDFPEPADWDEPTPVLTPAASSLPAGSPMALSTPTPALSSSMVIDYAYGHYAR